MLQTDAAHQRPGNTPASAPEASHHKSPQTQKQENPGLPASQRRKSQPGETTAADLTAGTMDTSHIRLIYGGHPPPSPWNSTPHESRQYCSQYLNPSKSDGRNTSMGPSLHDTIPSGKETSKPAVAARSCDENLRPMPPLSHALYSRQNPPPTQSQGSSA